jgi:hypothetical protein
MVGFGSVPIPEIQGCVLDIRSFAVNFFPDQLKQQGRRNAGLVAEYFSSIVLYAIVTSLMLSGGQA